MSEGARGIVLGHASVAEGLVRAARQISGAGEEALTALSNDGQGPQGLEEQLRAATGGGPCVIFTDLPSGSCAFAARRLSLMRPDTAIVCGVNLPVLLDFVFHREMALPQLVARLMEKGRAGLVGTCPEDPAHADCVAAR